MSGTIEALDKLGFGSYRRWFGRAYGVRYLTQGTPYTDPIIKVGSLEEALGTGIELHRDFGPQCTVLIIDYLFGKPVREESIPIREIWRSIRANLPKNKVN